MLTHTDILAWESIFKFIYLVLEFNLSDIEEYEMRVRQSIYVAAEATIPKRSGKSKRKAVPWWNDKCEEAVKNRNRSFRILKRTHNFQHLIEYKEHTGETSAAL